jgi:membrane dipeptidase
VLAVFDGHNDALTSERGHSLAEAAATGHLDLPRMRAGGIRGAIFAVFTPSPEENWAPLHRDDGVIEFEYARPVAHAVADRHASMAASHLLELERLGHARVARGLDDLDAALRDEAAPPACVLHLEGAEAIDPGLENLERWYETGLRSLGPVWSRANAFAHGVPFVSPSTPDLGPGLTAAGARLLARCAELGVLFDLSHINEAGFWDVARLDPGPLVASHCAAHALCPTSRNLTDRQLDAVGASDGLVGIVFACQFLRADFREDPDTPVALIAEHARYVADRIGASHVALGSDFDGATVPAAVKDAGGMTVVLDALRAAGFTEHELADIAWGNWRRVLGAWWRE